MVLLVVELESGGRDMGLEGVLGVGEVNDFEGHIVVIAIAVVADWFVVCCISLEA